MGNVWRLDTNFSFPISVFQIFHDVDAAGFQAHTRRVSIERFTMSHLEPAEAAENRNFSVAASNAVPRSREREMSLAHRMGEGGRRSGEGLILCRVRDVGEKHSFAERAGVRCRRSQMTKPEEYRFYKGDPNNDIQAVSKEALNHAIKKCHQTLWAGGKLSPVAAL
jgi:hypothetical protein